MERLTKNINGVICYVGDHKQNDEDVPAEMTTGAVRDVLTSLFAYEEALEKGKIAKIPENSQDIDFMRLFELIMADAEKRVVVLPCKVGDTVFMLWPCGKYGKSVCELEVCNIDIDFLPDITFSGLAKRGGGTYRFFKLQDIGKTVFLTREAAEEALQKTLDTPQSI